MRAIDWLKPLRIVSHRECRRMIGRTIGRSARRTAACSRVARCELLETRQLLSAVSVNGDNDAGTHQHVHVTESFYLPPQQRLGGAGALLSGPVGGEPMDVAIGFLRDHATQLGLSTNDLDEFVVSSQYTDEGSGTAHIYLRQTFDGLEVMHADISISLTARNEVIHVASSFVRDAQPTDDVLEPFVVSAASAFQEWSDDKGLELLTAPRVVSADETAADSETLLALDGTALEDVAARLVYVPTANGLERAWQLDVHDADYRHWVTAYVSAADGESLYTNGNVEFATYNVYAFPTQSPLTGSRSQVVDPHDALASPFGWHDTNGAPGAEFTDTRGNNVSAQEDGDHDNAGGFRPDGGANLNFDFALDTAQDPALYQSAAITNAYYWVNLLHDIHYQYGFTEAAGNFQVNNYGRGGIGNDPVIVDIQDGDGGTDGFATLPDGQSPRMSLYKRDNPYRDRAYDSDIIIHEFGHGISGRLTGGPGNTTALNAIQSKAMGEGWGDWWALMLTQVPADAKLDAYPLGNYAAGFAPDGPGIRPYPYSFDKAIDPLTYANFNGGTVNNEEHKAGTIWASALWDMNWLLIDKHGFSADMLHGNGGNNLALRLVMDGLKLQGTNPSFLAGRDAILAADVALTGGANQSEIWQAFARRGMGLSASDGGGAGATTVVEAFDVPAVIRGTVFRDDNGDGTQNGNEPGLAGRPVYRDLNNNGVQDVPTTTTFTQTPNGALPDAPNIKFTKVVSGLSGVITDINLTVNVTHPQDGDLYITLISPAGTPVILSNYLGDTGDNFTNTTFDDEAATFISQGSAPFTGSFKPYFNLSQLDGRDPNGTWTLRFDDRAAGNTGTLLSWSLQISAGNADPVTITDANGDYAFFGLSNTTHHVRTVVPMGFSQTAPAGGVHDVVIANGQSVSDRDFSFRAAATIASVSTLQNTLSSAITVTPPANLGVTHFKVSGIANGSLFQSDGSTPIVDGAFITVATGASGLRFLPSLDSTLTGRFDVELSADGSSVITDTSKAGGTIAVGSLGGFSLNKASVSVNESGTTETFTAVLMSPPTSNVVLSVISSDQTEATVSPATLTFTPLNWNVAQVITVTGANDALDDGDIVSNVVVRVIDAQSDDAFDPLFDQALSVTTHDDDSSGFTITPTNGGTTVTESGTTDSFTVVLTSQPTSNVVLSVASSDPTEATVSASSLTFTAQNWNVAQTVIVTGVDDVVDDGDIVSTVTLSVVDATSDNSFDPLVDQTVLVTTVDNDGVGFAIVESNGSTVVSEALTIDSFTIVLTAQPASNVVISAVRTNGVEPDLSPSTLTFTSANWSTPQTVFVRGVDDFSDDGDVVSTITVSIIDAQSADAFDAVLDQLVNVTTIDNDSAGVVVTQSDGSTSVTEAGTTDTVNVVLTSQPSANVVLSITGSDATEVIVSPTTLTFTPQNWNVAQTVTATGVADALSDGNQQSLLLISVIDSQSDDGFDLLADQTVSVTTSDVNLAPTISTVADLSLDEDGTTDAIVFTVGDAETATSSLVVTATSSNQNVLLASGITFGGSGATRSVTLKPIANRFGTTTVTLTVDDGSQTTSDSFVLTVHSINDVPTITTISNRTINEDSATAPINFTISDVETPSGQLVVTASSSDAELIPANGLVLSGTTAARSLIVTPAADHFGTATITVNVSDGTASKSTSFLLTVNNTSDVPVVPAATFEVPENSISGTSVGVVTALVPQADAVTFAITGGNDDGAFALNATTGEVTVAIPRRLNFELRQTATLVVTATNAANEVGSGTITINITDVINERLLIDPNEFQSSGVTLKREGDLVVARRIGTGALIDQVPVMGLLGIDAVGRNDMADSLLVDLSGGSVLVGALNFVGGTQGASGVDELLFWGGSTQQRVAHTLTGPTDGQVRFGEALVAVFTGVERLVDRLPAVARSILLPAGNDVSSLATVLDQNVTRQRLTSGANATHVETIFATPTSELTIDGGLGNDSLSVLSLALTSAQRLLVNGGEGHDVLDVNALSIPTTLSGGLGNDTLRGGRSTDRLLGDDGADSITGSSGNDTILGGEGLDTIFGGTGNDGIDGGLGNDIINGQDGDDSLLGGDGHDQLNGALGNDTADGGAGSDNVRGEDGNDVLMGGLGADRLIGGNHNDRLLGGDDADVIYGDAGDDTVDGGAGDDQLRGSFGADDIDGGLGVDRIFEEADSNFVLIGSQLSSPALGTETGRNIERFNIVGGPSANVLDARLGTVKVYLYGMDGADSLYGTSLADRLEGGNGDDILSGGAGFDALIGGAGFDTVYERADSNVTITGLRLVSTVTGDETAVTVERIALVGGVNANRLDARQSSVPVILLGGHGNDTLLGSAFPDVISGGSRTVTPATGDGSDSIDGQAGADLIALDPVDVRVADAADQLLADIFAQLPNWLDQV